MARRSESRKGEGAKDEYPSGNYTLVNFDPSALRVEVGIEPGSDPELRQNEILAFLGDLYKEALTKGRLRFVSG